MSIKDELTPMEKEVLNAEIIDHLPKFSKFLQSAVKHILQIINTNQDEKPLICGKWKKGDWVKHKDGSEGIVWKQIYGDCVYVHISNEKNDVWRAKDIVE